LLLSSGAVEDALDDEKLVRALGAGFPRQKHLGHSARAKSPDDFELSEFAGRSRAQDRENAPNWPTGVNSKFRLHIE
jgi:hypothetical protein